MEEKNEVIVEENTEQGKKTNFFSNVWKKTVDISKKTAETVQKKTKSIAEKNKENQYKKRMERYNPLFPEQFKSENFHLPNIIKIVDDAVRKDIDVCEGAIGWLERVKEIEILYLYDEWVEQSGIEFVPFWKCDHIYCVDNFNRNRYINANSIFSKSTEEKLAELENIAYCLGAKFCSIEIIESDKEVGKQTIIGKLKSGVKGVEASSNTSSMQEREAVSSQKGKTVSTFVGHNNPKRPQLKWFAHDDNIKGLIEKRCNDIQSIESKTLELSGASFITMNKNMACAIDVLSKVKGDTTMQQQSMKESSSTLIFKVEF
ncbi:MAG: hypothetical protein IJX30_07310 [Clostridia bacterium]|nr:hypothetical protein [Clostridia bacterium]